MCACTRESWGEYLPVFAEEPKACSATLQFPNTCYQDLFIVLVLPFLFFSPQASAKPQSRFLHSSSADAFAPQCFISPLALQE